MFQLDRRDLIKIVAIAVLYYAAASFGLLWAVDSSSATPLWPPAGIAATCVLIFGLRIWPGIFVGAFVANITHFIALNQIVSASMFAGAALIAVGNLLEAVTLSYLSRRFVVSNTLSDVNSIFKFVPIVAISSLVSGCLGTLIMLAMGLENISDSGLIFVTWWLGDSLAILIVAPFLMSWWPLPKFQKNYPWAELLAAFSCLLLFCEIIFGRHIYIPIVSSRPSLLIPVLVWLVFRFSRRELVTGLALVSVVAIYATANGKGPFVSATLNESFLSEQLFCAMIAITTLIMSASVSQERTYQQKLKDANTDLELRVAERTKELERKTRVLEAINNQLLIEARERHAVEVRLLELQSKES